MTTTKTKTPLPATVADPNLAAGVAQSFRDELGLHFRIIE